MIAWLDVQEVFAIITVAGMIIAAWREEKRQARAEARRETQLDDLERKTKHLEEEAGGYLVQIAELEARIIQLESK